MKDLLHKDLTDSIIKVYYSVYNELGYGFLEKVYQNAFYLELKNQGFDEVLTSIDFDIYAKTRDEECEKILPIKRYTDSFLIYPNDVLKADKTPYKVFTAFYNSLEFLHSSNNIKEFETPKNLKKSKFDYSFIPTLNDLGFKKQDLPDFLYKSAGELIDIFSKIIENYQ